MSQKLRLRKHAPFILMLSLVHRIFCTKTNLDILDRFNRKMMFDNT